MMAHDRAWRVHAAPSRDARAQPQLGIVTVREEILVESADLVQHGLPVHRRASIRPQYLLFAIELPLIQHARPAPPILPIRKDQMPYLIDSARILPHHH